MFDTLTNEEKATYKHLIKLVGVYLDSKAFEAANPNLDAVFKTRVLFPLLALWNAKSEVHFMANYYKDLYNFIMESGKHASSVFDEAAAVKIVADETKMQEAIAADDWAKFVKEQADMCERFHDAMNAQMQDDFDGDISKPGFYLVETINDTLLHGSGIYLIYGDTIVREALANSLIQLSDIKKQFRPSNEQVNEACTGWRWHRSGMMGVAYGANWWFHESKVYKMHNPAFTPEFELHILTPLLMLWHGPPYDVIRDDHNLYKEMHEYMTEHDRNEPEEIDGVFNFAAKMVFLEDDYIPDFNFPRDPEDWAKFVKVERGKYELFRSQLDI